MKALEAKITAHIQSFGSLDFPGGKIQGFSRGKKIVDVQFGKTWPLYDVASLTKIIFSASQVMGMVGRRELSVDEPIGKYLPWHPYPQITMKQILRHSAGYQWWYPFYQHIDLHLSPADRFCQLQRLIRQQKIKPTRQSVYSDIDLFVIAAVLERQCQRPLLAIWQDFHQRVLPNTNFHFCYDNQPLARKSHYAPTEQCGWRKKLVQGQVHDENAWAVGGVSANAGLFGGIEDISGWGLLLRKDLRDDAQKIAPSSVIKKFIARQTAGWGLGFMKPSGASTSGRYFSPKSFGHTGFTGMSLWMDPKRDLLVVMASNRINPSRTNKDFIVMRPQIHDLIVEHLQGH